MSAPTFAKEPITMRTCYLTITVIALSFTTISAVDAQSPPKVPYDASIMSGFPPAQNKRITLKNWQAQPFNHWAFMHMEQVVRTALVDRGAGPVSQLNKAPRSLASLKFKAPTGETISVAEALAQIDCNGYLLIKDGEIVFEYYANGFGPRMRQLTQSAGKSVAGTLAAALIDDGVLDEKKLVTECLPEMKGSAYEGATLRHVLNMTAGVKYSEDYYDPKAEVYRHEISHAWKPPQEGIPETLYEFLPTLKDNDRDHDVRFEYCSAHTDVLAWIIERATGKRLTSALSDRIWSRLGAEQDAIYTVDGSGTACANGGFCVSLRDFGRFGQMMLQNGFYNGQQIVPASVVEDCFVGNHAQFIPSAKGGLISKELPMFFKKGAYQNHWWAMDVDNGARTLALGSFGNLLYLDRERNVVMAQLATQRVNADIPIKRLEFAMLAALLAELEE
jgi:CubicO group peptidase (beta-lactamase class C family)